MNDLAVSGIQSGMLHRFAIDLFEHATDNVPGHILDFALFRPVTVRVVLARCSGSVNRDIALEQHPVGESSAIEDPCMHITGIVFTVIASSC